MKKPPPKHAMKKRVMKRRHFLRGLAGAALTLPIANSFKFARAVAQDTDVPVRFLAVRTGHGTDVPFWRPQMPGGGMPTATDMALSALNFDYDRSFLRPLQGHPLRDKVTVIEGIDHWANMANGVGHGGHYGASTALCGARTTDDSVGRPSGQSLDQFLYDGLAPGEGPHLITASVSTSANNWKAMSYRPDGSTAAVTLSPADVFSTVFAGFAPVDMPEAPVDYSGAERSVLDHSLEEIRTLRAQLSGAERERLESHLAAMERIQAEIRGPEMMGPTLGCLTTPANPGDYPGFRYNGDHTSVTGRTRLHAQVIAQAFACGRSRVGTLMLLDDHLNPYFTLPEVRAAYPDISGEFHDPITHQYWSPTSTDRIRRIFSMAQQYQTRLVLDVLTELDRVVDPMDPSGRSVLDNTIVYWHNEFGHGPHSRQGANHPTLIAGGGGGRFRMGRYLRVREQGDDFTMPPGTAVPNNKILVSIARAMGHEIDFYGDAAMGRDRASFPEFFGDLSMLTA